MLIDLFPAIKILGNKLHEPLRHIKEEVVRNLMVRPLNKIVCNTFNLRKICTWKGSPILNFWRTLIGPNLCSWMKWSSLTSRTNVCGSFSALLICTWLIPMALIMSAIPSCFFSLKVPTNFATVLALHMITYCEIADFVAVFSAFTRTYFSHSLVSCWTQIGSFGFWHKSHRDIWQFRTVFRVTLTHITILTFERI